MSTEKEVQGEVIIEPETVVEKQSPALPEKKPESFIDWNYVNKSKHYQFMDVLHNGSKYMKPEDVNYVYKQTTNIRFENDPYSEMYYHIKTKEKEEGASLEAARMTPFLSSNQKVAIKRSNDNTVVAARMFSKNSQSLGTVLKHNSRYQTPLLDLSELSFDDDASGKSAHLRVLASIESGFIALLKIEKTNAKIQQCSNPLSLPFLKNDLDQANKQLLQSFFIEQKDDEYDIKAKWLIRLMTFRKGKKLLISSCSLFSQRVWLLLLSYILPYVLIWTDDESQRDIDALVLEMIKELLNSQYVDLAFITSIMEMFVKLKTYPCI